MSRRPWVVVFVGLAHLLCLGVGGCSSEPAAGGGWTSTCIDDDGDGYGLNCAAGGDCDDTQPNIHTGCTACATPEEGCTCPEGSEPVTCHLPAETGSSGTLICRDGTRYCRDGRWSACRVPRS